MERRYVVKLKSFNTIENFGGKCTWVDYSNPNVCIFCNGYRENKLLVLAMVPWHNIDYIQNALWDIRKDEMIQ